MTADHTLLAEIQQAGRQVVQPEMVVPGSVCPAAKMLSNDDSSDDRDDSGPLNYDRYSPKMHLPCLVTTSARSWQCGGQGFEFP
jgi:hypothetical protein